MRSLPKIRTILALLGTAALVAACQTVVPSAMQPVPDAVQAVAGETGKVSLTVLWPARAPYQTQEIPTNANSLVFEILDATETRLAGTTVTRPSNGELVSEVSLGNLPAGTDLTARVRAYQDEQPGLGSTILAEGSSAITVQPSTVTVVTITLTASTRPIITSMPANAGPNSYITLQGSHFTGETDPEVTFGGIPSPYVFFVGNDLRVLVPGNAKSGRVVVTANGVSGQSGTELQIIRSLQVTPSPTQGVVGQPVTFTLAAADEDAKGIADPDVTWACSYLHSAGGEDKDKDTPGPTPSTAIVNGVFTPSLAGNYRITVSAGTTQATVDLSVVEPN